MKWEDVFKFLFGKKDEPAKPEFGTGALVDPRTPEEIEEQEIMFGQIVANTNAVNWSERPRDEWRTFEERNQGQGNSCMANAYAKAHGVLTMVRDGKFVRFSAAHLYQRRANRFTQFPAGMYLGDVFDIGAQGVTLEDLVPSDFLLDAQIDALKLEPHEEAVGKIFASDSVRVYIPNGSFEDCASIIQTTRKAIVGMFYFTAEEWSREAPVIKVGGLKLTDPASLRHGIALVDAFTYQGVNYILAEDSAHFGGLSYRLLTREFFEARNFGAAYEMRFKFDQTETDRPSYDGSIISVQKCLRFEGFFPTNISYVENLGPVTRDALKKWQAKYMLTPSGQLDTPTKDKLIVFYG